MVPEVRPRPLVAATIWVSGSTIAWALGSSALASPVVTDPRQLTSLALSLATVGVVIGATLGVSGWIALRRFLDSPLKWLAVTAIGVPVVLAIGFLANGAFLQWQVHRLGMVLTGEGGGASMSPSAPLTLALAGFVLGCIQLPFLARDLTPNRITRILWVLGVIAALGVGWFGSAALVGSTPPPTPMQGALMGAISGLMVMMVLWVLDVRRRRPTPS